MSYVEWTPEMGEISGMGGGYEDTCRAMVKAGVEWMEAHPEADPQFQGYPGIYGVITEENQAAKDLTAAVIAAAEPFGATGAMHQATIGHILAFRRLGAEEYCRSLRERERKDA
ncbi:MAG TPA: hypothetical protein VK681_39155 [Reyranella sp.]|nr:hypothetical protein [Reyranella sp.]